MITYLESFFERSQPLVNLAEIKKGAESEFNHAWKSGSLPGWNFKVEETTNIDLFCVACNMSSLSLHVLYC
jgi:hypothetical protein